MTSVLHSLTIIHTVQYTKTGSYELMQLTLHDAALLQQFTKWLNPIVKISKISTLENTQKVYEVLVEYTRKQELVLPIISASQLMVFEAD
jgi:hypothetical protein